MNTQLTKKINELYKTQCLRDKLKSAYDLLNAKFKDGVDEVLPELTSDDANFSEVRKMKSKGTTGTVDFTVAFGKALVRSGEKDEKDQSWLKTLGGDFTVTKLVLSKSSVRNALKKGELDADDLALMEIEEQPTMQLTLSAAFDEKRLGEFAKLADDALASEG